MARQPFFGGHPIAIAQRTQSGVLVSKGRREAKQHLVCVHRASASAVRQCVFLFLRGNSSEMLSGPSFRALLVVARFKLWWWWLDRRWIFDGDPRTCMHAF